MVELMIEPSEAWGLRFLSLNTLKQEEIEGHQEPKGWYVQKIQGLF